MVMPASRLRRCLRTAVPLAAVVGLAELVLAASALFPVQTPAAPAAQVRDTAIHVPIGTASIEGTVTTVDTGRALEGALVSASASDGRFTRSVLTDDQGHFVIPKLPGGQYNLSASRSRYLPAIYGQKAPNRPGTPVRLDEGQHVKGVTIALFVGGVITGAITDERGEPVLNARVAVLRSQIRGGTRTETQIGTAQTDDRGVYRIFGLLPGEYLVRGVLALDRARVSAADVERAVAAAASAGGTAVATPGGPIAAVTIDTSVREDGPQDMPNAPTYYPGTALASGATIVRVAAGEERSNIDFQLLRIATTTVQGVVMNSTGALPAGVVVLLTDPDLVSTFVTEGVDPQGRFEFRNVAPGQYTLIARWFQNSGAARRGAQPAATAAALRGQPWAASPEMLGGRTDVSVNGSPMSNVSIILDVGRSVSGRIVFDGAATKPDLATTRVLAALSPVQDALKQYYPAIAIVGPDGRFTLNGVQPGRYTLQALSRPGQEFNAPGWFLRSSLVNGQDTLDVPIELGGGQDISNAVVTFTDRTTELSGRMIDPQNLPATDDSIVAFATDERLWASSRRIRQTRPANDGHYAFRDLPPGEYFIAVVTDAEPDAWLDPEFLRALIPTTVRVTLGDGEKKVQDLRVGR